MSYYTLAEGMSFRASLVDGQNSLLPLQAVLCQGTTPVSNCVIDRAVVWSCSRIPSCSRPSPTFPEKESLSGRLHPVALRCMPTIQYFLTCVQSGPCESGRVCSRVHFRQGSSLPEQRAYGVFECTHDCSDITSASFLNTVGKKTDVLLRISTVGPGSGSADTVRDVRGWAMKLYTDQGNLDWVFNNTVCGFLEAWAILTS